MKADHPQVDDLMLYFITAQNNGYLALLEGHRDRGKNACTCKASCIFKARMEGTDERRPFHRLASRLLMKTNN